MWNPQGRLWLVLGAGAWVVLVVAGMKLVLDHGSRSGAAAVAPAVWPASSRLARDSHRGTLLLFAHPRCPCTRASLGELERIVARAHGRLAVTVVFAVPRGSDPIWARSDRWHEARTIPGVRLFVDSTGTEEGRFGVATSGQALFYDAGGRLRFAGGITVSRGHAGDNAGADAVVALAEHDSASWQATPVYGCALDSPSKGAATSCPER